MKKLNGLAEWIMVALAVGAIIYNTIVTHVILKNDLQHLQTAFREYKEDNAKEHQIIRDDIKQLWRNK